MTTRIEHEAEDARIDAAAAAIKTQAERVERMSDSDPRKLEERRILNAMRHNQAAAMTNRSIAIEDDAAVAGCQASSQEGQSTGG